MQNHCLLFSIAESGSAVRSAGPHRIATWLRGQGWDVEVVDWAAQWSLQELQSLFRSRYHTNTKFVGFGNMFNIWTTTLEEFCVWIKQQYPHVVITAGASTKPLYVSHSIDYYISGFGEHAMVALLKWLFGNGTRPIFELFKVNGGQLIDANKHYAAYPMKSLSIIYQDRDFVKPHEWLTVETARGCKFKCGFCNFPVLGVKGDYSRDASDFDRQIQDIYDRFGVKNFVLADETFNDRTEKISKFADVVEKLPFDPWFVGYVRADLLISRPHDREELLRMKVLGQFYGIESFNTESARVIGKGMPGDKLQQGLTECLDYFQKNSNDRYRGTVSLIIGLPHETETTLEATRRWLSTHWRGQSFYANPLHLNLQNLSHKSDMDLNYSKYGYSVMPDTVIAEKSLVQKKVLGDGLYWQNQYMDYFKASAIADSWISNKNQDDSRMICFALARKIKNHPDLPSRLQMRASDSNHLFDDNIDKYISSKLNWA